MTHLLLDLVCDVGRLLLDELDLTLDVAADGLEVPHDGALDGVGKLGVALREELGRVADVVEDGLPAVRGEDMALVERDLDGLGESAGRARGGVLDVDEAL